MVTLHRYSASQEAGDLSEQDLKTIYGILESENLVQTVFHDGSVACLMDFIEIATYKHTWFYAAKHSGVFIGFAYINTFSTCGNTAFLHGCSFSYGRQGAFRIAGRKLLHLLKQKSEIENLLTITPTCYRSARYFVLQLGFEAKLEMPNYFYLQQNRKKRKTGGSVFYINLKGV